ncbi:MAG: ThuA domain-containing protein [Bacillota bacterium]
MDGGGATVIHVLVWYEGRPLPEAAEMEKIVYPGGIHGALGTLFSAQTDMEVRTALQKDTAQGLSDDALAWADVLVYFSHKYWRDIEDERVDAVQKHVLEGMGLVLLHSSHASKIFSRMMGTRTQCLRWREGRTITAHRVADVNVLECDGEWQRVWLVAPSHPIAEGLEGEYFWIPKDETYGEYFEIPAPEELVFLTTSEGGEVLRSGCCWHRGAGKIFYFASGHETFPVYYQPEVRRVLVNAVRWAASAHVRKRWPVWAREAPREQLPGSEG